MKIVEAVAERAYQPDNPAGGPFQAWVLSEIKFTGKVWAREIGIRKNRWNVYDKYGNGETVDHLETCCPNCCLNWYDDGNRPCRWYDDEGLPRNRG